MAVTGLINDLPLLPLNRRGRHFSLGGGRCQGVDVAACGAELQLQPIGRRGAAAAPCI